MIKIDMKQVAKFESDLHFLNDRGIPYAVRGMLNNAAFDARRVAQENIKRNMITRNKWTVNSVQVEKAQGTNVDRMQSTVGSLQPYMATQEFGGTKRSKGKEGTPIATQYASGEAEGSQPRKRLPRPSNRLRRITLRKERAGKNRRQRNAIAVRQAAKSRQKYVYLDTGRSKGIYKVLGGRKKPRVKMVHNLSHKVVRIPKNPWLHPAVVKTALRMPEFYAQALQFQIDKARAFNGF